MFDYGCDYLCKIQDYINLKSNPGFLDPDSFFQYLFCPEASRINT